VTNSGSHNTVCGLDGKHVYLAGLKSPLVSVLDAGTNDVVRQLGPFSAPVRPFTVDGSGSRLFACVNGRLGFEVADARTGKVLATVDVPDMKTGKPKRHGCPSHGIALTPDETELWLTDSVNTRLHVYDATVMPPAMKGESIVLRDEPGWLTFSLDGRYAYPSTGEVVDAQS
jgi:DNA-binding beta-propeller fold protein YncE